MLASLQTGEAALLVQLHEQRGAIKALAMLLQEDGANGDSQADAG